MAVVKGRAPTALVPASPARRLGAAGVGLLVAATALTGCTTDPEPGPVPCGDGAGRPPAAAASSDVEQEGVTREVPFGGTSIRLTVDPVEVEDGLATLTVDYEPLEGELPPLGDVLAGAEPEGTTGASGLRLVDLDALEVLPVLAGPDGTRRASGLEDLGLGSEQHRTTSMHAAPHGETVDVMVPLLGYVPDVPVVRSSEGCGNPLASPGETAGASRYPLQANRQAFDGTAGGGALPAATGPVVAAGETATFQAPGEDGATYRLAVRSVERRGGALVGTFELGLVSGDGGTAGAFGTPDARGARERGFDAAAASGAPIRAALLDGSGSTYPFEYATPAGTEDSGDTASPGEPGETRRRLLADERVDQAVSAPGGTARVEVVWPDTGADRVTVDLPGVARFVDVPVTDAG